MELLERDALLAALHCRLQQAATGQGSVLLLGGEAGAGKTSLLRRFCDGASAHAAILLGHCDALSTPRALGPLSDMSGAEPELRRLLNDNAPRDLLFRTVLHRLTAGNLLTVLAIEDAHWADEATLDLLRFLGRRIESARSLVIATYRDDEVGPHHPLRHVLGDLATATAVHRLSVPPLTADGVAKLAEGSQIDAAALFERTRGNPFFVTEVLAAACDIPPTARDAVLARAGRLTPAAREVLEVAAVIGSPIDLNLLEQVARPAPENLEACVDIGMLLADGQSLAFRHELAREAILDAMCPPHRAKLHHAVLRALEQAPARLQNAALLAHHAEEAGDTDAVLRHAPAAARTASLLHAHREAAAQYARALHFASALPVEEQAGFLEARSYACYLTSQVEEAIAAREAALAIWTTLGDKRKEGENRSHLATLYWAQARIGEAEREAEAAVALMEQFPPGAELALAYGTLARLSGTNLDTADAICLGNKAIALAERAGASETLTDATITVGEAMLARGMIASGQCQIERGMRLAAANGLDELTARAYISLGYGFAECGQCATAAQHFERGIHFCVERDLDLPLQHLTALLARCHLSLGNWDEASQLAKSVLNASVAPASRFVALLVAGSILSRRGEPGATTLLDEALALAKSSECIVYIGPVYAARAEAAFLAGVERQALREARAAYALAAERRHMWCLGELAYWRRKCGDPVPWPAPPNNPFALQIAGNWQAAARAWEARGCPYEAARARAESHDEAALRAALVTFEKLQARPAAAGVKAQLRAMGVRGIPRGPRRATRANPAGLTPREVEVIGLLAEGRGNQQIAERLFLSPRTVENHVAAILAKLGASTRGEAASTAADLGLVP